MPTPLLPRCLSTGSLVFLFVHYLLYTGTLVGSYTRSTRVPIISNVYTVLMYRCSVFHTGDTVFRCFFVVFRYPRVITIHKAENVPKNFPLSSHRKFITVFIRHGHKLHMHWSILVKDSSLQWRNQ